MTRTREPTRRSAKPDEQRPQSPARSKRGSTLALFLALTLVGTTLLAPAAAADNTSTKDVCDGDVPEVGNPVDGTGLRCVRGTLETRISCPQEETFCRVWGQTTVEVHTPLTCGYVGSNATHDMSDPDDRTSKCVEDPPFERSASSDWEIATSVAKADIPADGLDVWYNLEVCVGNSKTANAPRVVCATYTHHDWIPPQGDGLPSPVPFAEGAVDHAENVAEDANPVSVSTN